MTIKKLGGGVLDIAYLAGWQWAGISFDPYHYRNDTLTVTVTPKNLSEDTTLGFVLSASDLSLPALKVNDDSWDSFQIFYMIFVTGTAALTVAVFFLLSKKRVRTAFFLTWCWFLMMFMFLVPPSDGYDEGGHAHYASITADRIARYPHENEFNGLLISRAEINTGLSDQAPKHDYYVWFLGEISKKNPDASELVEITQETAMQGEYPPFIFFFYALGILLARKLLLTGAGIMLLARFFGLIPLIALVLYTLRRLPFGRELVFLILSFPAALQAIVTINPDGEVIVLTLSLVAATLHQMLKDKAERMNWTDFADYGIMLLSCFTLSQCKYGATVPLCLIPLVVAFRRKAVKKGAVIGAVTISIGSILAGFLPMFLRNSESKGASAWSEYYTFSDVLFHPISSFRVLLTTIDQSIFFWSRQLIGSVLGNVNLWITDFYLIVFTILMVIALFAAGEDLTPLHRRERAAFAVITMLGFLCIMGGMMIGATPKGLGVINGVQGRYFLPLLFPFFLAIAPENVRFLDKNRVEAGLVAVLPLVLCFAATGAFLQS